MKFIKKIMAIFSPAGGASAGRAQRIYIVDGARLMDEKTGRRLGPREQVQMLQMLAKTAKQEGIQIQVVLESERPLREVENGGNFNGVTVHFVPDGDALITLALKLCRKYSAVMVSSGVTLEGKATEAGLTVMRNSTFRKAFCDGADEGMREHRRGGNGGSGDRRNRNKNRRGNRPPKGKKSEDGSSPSGNDAGSSKGEAGDPVRSLIDLVE